MVHLYNHTELTTDVSTGNIENALMSYHAKITLLPSGANEIGELKRLLNSINGFLFSYFCFHKNIYLGKLYRKNLSLVEESYSKKELVDLGEKIIRSYSRKQEDIVYTSQSEVMKKALFYIHSNLSKEITLSEVAGKVYLSRNYLCILFKRNVGHSFCEYLNIARTNQAKELLKKTSGSLELIASQCGFKSQSHFSTTFKKFVGLTPTQYRRANK